MSYNGTTSAKHQQASRNANKTNTGAVFNFDGEYLTRAQIAERVCGSRDFVSDRITELRKEGVRVFTAAHFA